MVVYESIMMLDMFSTGWSNVQLVITPDIEVFYMLFERYHSIFSMTSVRQHMEHFNFRC